MSTGYFGDRSKMYLDDLFHGLITSSHILHYHGIVDAYGHVSVRNPDNPKTFFMSRNMPPALMSSKDDIVEYHIDTAEPVESDAPKGFGERCIHSEIYKKFETVNAVLHAHSAPVLPFATTEVPLRPSIHTAGFLGKEVPVWDIASAYSSSDSQHDLLVRTSKTGASLAATFRPATSTAFLTQKLRSALPLQIGGRAEDPVTVPEHPVVLMRGHGFTTCADSLEGVVYQAFYTIEAAKALKDAIVMRDAYFEATIDGRVDHEAKGQIKNASVKTNGKDVKYLSDREVNDAWAFIKETMERSWALWEREVEVHPLYQNNITKGEKE